ncbi:MAG: glycerol-3-phosphate dehydrogenase C-terminal domain-containing protein, partial [Isosphaeraceae bacterium]
ATPVIRPSQGAHLVLSRAFLPGRTAIMIPKTDDGRVLFAIPWHGRTLVGTTDNPVKSLSIEPRPLAEEIEFLLSHAARYLSKDPVESDVLSTFAGLRPLISNGHAESTAKLSREHALLTSKSGLVTITGGKWTTYRRMGADAVDRASEVADLPRQPCATESLHLHGWQDAPTETEDDAFAVYGSDAEPLIRLCTERPDWSEPLHPSLPYRAGEAVWAARHESARTVEDVLSRRTRALLLDARASIEAAPRVAALLAEELGFDDLWQQSQVEAYRELALGYILGGQGAASG